MSLPRMTFSFRPRRESDLPSIAASVSTRVVSWKEAALGHDATVLVLEATALREHAREQVGVARLDDRDPAQHLPHDDLDVLVVDRHTLLAVDVLHLVDEVHLRLARAEDAEHVLRVDV